MYRSGSSGIEERQLRIKDSEVTPRFMDKQISLYDIWIVLLHLGWQKGYITSSQVPFPDHLDSLKDNVVCAFRMADRYCEWHRKSADVLMNVDDKRVLALMNSAYLGFLSAWDNVMSGWMEALTGEPVQLAEEHHKANEDPRQEVTTLLELTEEESKEFHNHLGSAAVLAVKQLHTQNIVPADLLKAGEAMYLYGMAIGTDTFTGSED